MSERFTDLARRAVVLAQEEARVLNHDYIGTEHLLLGLTHEGDGLGGAVLARLAVDTNSIRRRVNEIIGQGQRTPPEHIGFTVQARRVLELSLREALELGHNRIGTEHILLGLTREGAGVAAQVLLEFGASHDNARSTTLALLDESGGINRLEFLMPLILNYASDVASVTASRQQPVHDRQHEVRRAAQALSRHSRNNPVLVGVPGVGRATLVTGLAQALAAGDVAPALRDKRVYQLVPRYVSKDIDVIAAMNALREDTNAVLYVPKIADLAGTGPLGDQLRVAVIHGQVRVITIATPEEFATVEPGLARVLQPVRVPEMSTATATKVLNDVRVKLQDHYGLEITDEALSAAAEFAHLHIRTSPLPGSAVDLVDEVCARIQTDGQPVSPESVAELDARIETVRQARAAAAGREDIPTASALRTKELTLLAERESFVGSESTVTSASVIAIGHRIVAESEVVQEVHEPVESTTADLFGGSAADLWMIS